MWLRIVSWASSITPRSRTTAADLITLGPACMTSLPSGFSWGCKRYQTEAIRSCFHSTVGALRRFNHWRQGSSHWDSTPTAELQRVGNAAFPEYHRRTDDGPGHASSGWVASSVYSMFRASHLTFRHTVLQSQCGRFTGADSDDLRSVC